MATFVRIKDVIVDLDAVTGAIYAADSSRREAALSLVVSGHLLVVEAGEGADELWAAVVEHSLPRTLPDKYC